jgi:hypothetical protein
MNQVNTLKAGAAVREISPTRPMFLMGYTHTERTSTGIHDPLLSTALYLESGGTGLLFSANDVLYVSKALAARARRRIARETGVPESHILVSATHTHSGPVTVDALCSAGDPVVPPADPAYLQQLEDRITAAGIAACGAARPARLGLAVADGTGVGTNRRDPAGPSDSQVPVLVVREAESEAPIACMLECSMHPTVLHEDSYLVSADFPGFARRTLQEHILGKDSLGQACPVLYHTGPCGNQSPRHVTRANTFAEAQRLGELLGQAAVKVIPGITYSASLLLLALQTFVDLPRKRFPPLPEAQAKLEGAIRRLAELRQTGAPPKEIRTAEVDWFGAEETVTLVQAEADGRVDQAARACLPAEVQVLKVGSWAFVGWPGELFIEYALAVKKSCPGAFVISMANGELQGYIVTEEAAREGGYEASNGLFEPRSGGILVEATARLLGCG